MAESLEAVFRKGISSCSKTDDYSKEIFKK
jgi:hypothetical protein